MLRLKFMRQEKIASYLKKKQVFFEFGDNCKWASRHIPAEPYLVKIHNNVRVAANVTFCTHDIIDGLFRNCPQYASDKDKYRFTMGTIEVFDNVMIGANSTLMYNIKIGPNAIVGAGSVVTKDVPEGAIVAGNPAKIIGSFDDLAKRRAAAPKKATNSDSIEKIVADYWKNMEKQGGGVILENRICVPTAFDRWGRACGCCAC